MNIVHFPPNFFPIVGGAEVLTHNLAIHQQRAGHQVSVVVKWKSWRMVSGTVPYRLLPLLPKTFSGAIAAGKASRSVRGILDQQLALYQRRYQFDIWHVHGVYPTGFLAISMLKRFGVPCIVRAYGADIQTMPEIGYGSRLDPEIEKEVIHTAQSYDRIVAITNSMREEVKGLGVSSDKIVDIPNGVDIARIQSLAVNRSAARSELGLPADQKILLTVGRNHPKKGFHLIPEIARRVAEVYPDFLWIIAGRDSQSVLDELNDGAGLSQLQAWPTVAPRFEQGKPVQLLLPSDMLLTLYKAADIFVFPSLLEAFGIVLIEAMAAGIPVITTDALGCRDVIEHEITGMISPVGDTEKMADQIIALISNRELREALGENGAEKAREYDWRRISAQYVDAYRVLLDQKKVRT